MLRTDRARLALAALAALALGSCRTPEAVHVKAPHGGHGDHHDQRSHGPPPLTLHTVHTPTGSDALHNPLERH